MKHSATAIDSVSIISLVPLAIPDPTGLPEPWATLAAMLSVIAFALIVWAMEAKVRTYRARMSAQRRAYDDDRVDPFAPTGLTQALAVRLESPRQRQVPEAVPEGHAPTSPSAASRAA